MTMRRAVVLAHRWVALLAGLLLALLGLTGSVMVWQAELDAALNPAWFARDTNCAAPERPIAEVLALLARHAPQARASLVVAPQAPGAAYQVWERRDADTGRRREHFIDPACGAYLGSRERGAWLLDRAHAVPLLYDLHSRLLAGETGHIVAGVGALVLFGLAVSGVVLAWPRGGGSAAWRRVLGIKTSVSRARLWFDVHRALGLWLAPLAIVLTATGAALVFDTQARALVAMVLPTERLPKVAKASEGAEAAAGPAVRVAPDELVQQALRMFPQAQWSRLTLPASAAADAVAEVRMLQTGEPRIDTGSTRVRLAASGQVLALFDPLRTPAGSVVLDWVFPLHSGEALGLFARLLWSLFGLLPALLLGTGAWLWWRRYASAAGRKHIQQHGGPAAQRHT
jgi:uncharacterized iron-regulated membrane protein